MKSIFRTRTFRTVLAIVIIIPAAYFGGMSVMSYMGRQAQEATGLPDRTLDDAMLLARSQSKPIFVHLSAIWCPTCRGIEKSVLSDPAVKQVLNRKYIFARMDYDSPDTKEFQKANGLEGFPNLLILSADGKVLHQLPATTDPRAFQSSLEAE